MNKKQILEYCKANKTKQAEVPADLQEWFDNLLMHHLPDWFFDMQLDYVGEVTRDGWECDQWLFTIPNGNTFDYYTGIGLRGREPTEHLWESPYNTSQRGSPSVYYIFYSLCLDASLGDDTFENFCFNCGYDEDSRKAYKAWEDCQATAKKLDRLGVNYHELYDYFNDIGF